MGGPMQGKIICLSASIMFAMSCNKFSGDRKSNKGGDGGGSSESTTPIEVIEALPLPHSTLNTIDSDGDAYKCVDVTFKALAAGAAVKGATITFSMAPTMAEGGTITPESAETNDDGLASTKYCSGKAEQKLTIEAKAGSLSANSGEITVAASPEYEFIFLRSDVKITMAQDAKDPVKDGVIKLSIQDSGPLECATLVFGITRKNIPVANKVVKFRTQIDFPKGAKLARRSDTGTTEKDSATSKYFAVYEATSDEKGEFYVPICAGPTLGTVLISGTIKIDNNLSFNTQAPIVSIGSGFTHWANLSITYDPVNAKTLRGYFNTNSDHVVQFKVKANAKSDGDANADNPVSVVAETGRVDVANGGFPNGSGEVPFTMQALHLVDYRPYQVHKFTNMEAQSRCDVEGLIASGGITYANLSKNWRSTIVYMMRGSEYFHDANRNGVYDEGGDGFWDKNQNGIYDPGIDVITHDAGNDGLVDINGEWFIDLPSPFVDTNENGIYEPNIDILIGDEYVAPNGKRDKDTTIWKYDYAPIYVGESSFALLNSEIKSNSTPLSMSIDESQAYYDDLRVRGFLSLPLPYLFSLVPIDDAALWLGPATAAAAGRLFYLHAQGACGGPMLGGTSLIANFKKDPVEFGERTLDAIWVEQPEDHVREPSRRLLKESGTSTGVINFNVLDHPSRVGAYPISFAIQVGACTNKCKGDVATPGVACDSHTGELHITMDNKTLKQPYAFSSVITCTCSPGFSLDKDTCQ